MMTPLDAWVLARLSCGQSVNGELADVSEPFKGIADHLNGLPLADRQSPWNGFLASRPDQEAVIRAVADQDPEGPAPPLSASVTAVDSWEPLRLREPPKAMSFPVDVFPLGLEKYCRNVAESTLCPVDFVGAAMLATAGAAIGQSVNLQVKWGWTEAPLLYLVVVAAPGKAKTPAIRAATRPLAKINERLREESRLARERWEEAKKAHARDDAAPPPGPEPPQLRAIVKDITRESLCLVLADNPRGVLCSPDEATAWVGSFNQYRSGGTDEQFWLSVYSGDPVSVDRKGGRESTYVPHPFCAVLGGIQPDLLASLRDDRGRDNGFLDRIVFSFPDEFPDRQWTDQEVSPEAERDWSEAIDRLYAVSMRVVDDHPRPWLAKFTPEARARFVSWFNRNGREMGEPESRAGAMSKAEGRLARLALILSRLRLACDPCQVLQDADGVPPVSLADVEGAVRLTEYFANHLEGAAHRMTRGTGSADALLLAEWAKRNKLPLFREAEARETLRRFRDDPETLAAAIRLLTNSGVIRPKPETAISGKAGRKPSPAYEVHPDLLRGDSLSGESG